MPPPRKVVVLSDEQRQLVEDNILLMYKCWKEMKAKYRFLDKDDLYDCCTEAAVNAASSLDVNRLLQMTRQQLPVKTESFSGKITL